MNVIHLAVYPPVGEVFTAQLAPGLYTVGSAPEVPVQLLCAGVAERHVELWLTEDRVQVEPLGEGVRVNSCPIEARVEVAFPAAVEFAGVMLVLELNADLQRAARAELLGGVQITLPPRRELPEAPTDLPPSACVASEFLEAVIKSHCAPTVVGDWSGPGRMTHSGGRMGQRVEDGEEEAFAEDEAPLKGVYKLVREIARGGMGKIYFGEDAQLKRQVAVKVSTMAYAGEDPRFSKEAEVLAQLAHPNIVPIYHVGTDGQGRPYYAMKWVRGRTLQAILDGLAKDDPEMVREYALPTLLTIFRKVADAMAFAHSRRILHRDLKPENVMVGEYGEVLVMDWGLAKTLGETESSGVVRGLAVESGNYGMTMEGDVMGTPQYMSPEQAEGKVAELDERSDVYSLGGILYAILTLRAPIEGKTLEEVLTKVKSGKISSMESGAGGEARVAGKSAAAMERLVPEALRAVTLKAMSLEREKRYTRVEAFAADIEAYQNGFATHAEGAGAWKRMRLWVGRNKVLAGSAVAMLLVVSGFSAKVIVEGRKAGAALARLRSSAPTFAQRALDAMQDSNMEEALEAASNAVDLQPRVVEYHRIRGDVLQVMVRWPEAVREYRLAAGDEASERNLRLTEELMVQRESEGEAKAKGRLFEELNAQGRQYQAMALSKELGDFWKERRKDMSVVPELVKRLEAKLLPVPGTEVLMSSTELTVGEWKLYLRAEGLPEWRQPDPNVFSQTDEHPVVKITWNKARTFCEWLSRRTGKDWRLPTNAEWDAAVGNTVYPWGDHFPPQWNDGNYAVLLDGNDDSDKRGVDGFRGTAPVGSFRSNALGFFDLGGNASEWMLDGSDQKTRRAVLRGANWIYPASLLSSSVREKSTTDSEHRCFGFRVVQNSKVLSGGSR